jgi:hypothetical protein
MALQEKNYLSVARSLDRHFLPNATAGQFKPRSNAIVSKFGVVYSCKPTAICRRKNGNVRRSFTRTMRLHRTEKEN